MSNRQRAMKQLFLQPVVAAILAVPALGISCLLAQQIVVGGVFLDFWMGAFSVVTGLAGIGLVGFAVIAMFIGIESLLEQ